MKRSLRRLWFDDDGFVLSSEMVLYGTLGVVGVTAGYTALRDAVNSELDDVAKAIGAIDQSYGYSGVIGHSAFTAGSAFIDGADLCDHPSKGVVVAPPPPVPGRVTVCADVFGPSASPALPGYVAPAYPPAPGFVPAPGFTPAFVPGVSPAPGVRVGPEAPSSLPGASGPEKQDGKKGAKKPGKAESQNFPRVEDRRPVGFGGAVVDPYAAVVVGAPGLMPAMVPLGGAMPIRVMVNPWQAGPYMVNVPEGYFNHGPGAVVGSPYYQMYVAGRHGPIDSGYGYAPTAPAAAPGVPVGGGAQTIDLGFTKVGDDELRNIEKFKTARCLHVLGSNVTDAGLASIAQLEQLESLHIVGTQITDAGLKSLARLKKLRFLHLVGTRVTDVGLKALYGMRQLEEIDLRGSPVTEDGLVALSKALPTLRIVR